MNQDQKKQKLAQIKQKIKAAAPAAIAFTAAAASVALVINTVRTAAKAVESVEFEPFREVSGEEKTTLLGRDDIVIQEADPGQFYFISVVTPENPFIEN